MRPRYNINGERELVVSSVSHERFSVNKTVLGSQWLFTAMLEPGIRCLVLVPVEKDDVFSQ